MGFGFGLSAALGMGLLRTAQNALTPAAISGLLGWWEADGLALSNTDPVASFTDLSGNGKHATQATAGKRPLFATGVQNGLPGVLFDATDDGLQTALSLVRPYTLLLVEKVVSDDGLSHAWRTINSSANNLVSLSRGGANACYVQGTVSSHGDADGEAHVGVLRIGAAGSPATSYQVDGVERAEANNGADWPDLAFGASDAFPETANTYLLAALAYNTYLSAGNASTLVGHFRTKYGF